MVLPLNLKQIAEITRGEFSGNEHIISSICTDSRLAEKGCLFVPLIAERDGHDFIEGALANGAAGFLCNKGNPISQNADLADRRIIVEDTHSALWDIAKYHRDTVDPRVVAITGSNGKTTTKDFIYSVLSSTYKVTATKGSYNNEIGMPLTLCSLEEDSEILVVEVGARHIGDISQVMPILRPDYGVITTIGAAHLGIFGSVENIIAAKGELAEAIVEDKHVVINLDSPGCEVLVEETDRDFSLVSTRIGYFENPDIFAPSEIKVDGNGKVELTLGERKVKAPIAGVFQGSNMLLALRVAELLSVPQEAAINALENSVISPMRMDIKTHETLGRRVLIINDSYNGNEESTRSALETLASISIQKRIAVLGALGELGDGTDEILSSLAQHSVQLGIDRLISVSAPAYKNGRPDTQVVDNISQAVELLEKEIDTNTAILVKGSRAANLEKVVEILEDLL